MPDDNYEDQTAEQLHEEAARREIEGRSSMSKPELIKALRKDDRGDGGSDEKSEAPGPATDKVRAGDITKPAAEVAKGEPKKVSDETRVVSQSLARDIPPGAPVGGEKAREAQRAAGDQPVPEPGYDKATFDKTFGRSIGDPDTVREAGGSTSPTGADPNSPASKRALSDALDVAKKAEVLG